MISWKDVGRDGSSSQLVIIKHHYVGVDLSGQLSRLQALSALLLVTAVFFLLFILSFTSWVFGQRYLVEVLKGGVFREANGVNTCHLAFHKFELLGLEDNGANRVFSILESPIVVGLLSGLLPTLVVSKEDTGSLGELKLSLTKLARDLVGFLLNQLQHLFSSGCLSLHNVQPKGFFFQVVSATCFKALFIGLLLSVFKPTFHHMG